MPEQAGLPVASGEAGSKEPRPAEGAKADAAGALEAPSNGEASSEPEEPVTTLMIHHVPCHYSYDNLLQELESLGLRALNFAHLPTLPGPDGTAWNIGRAFLNFDTPADAEQARRLLAGHR